jgi:hypothetical protein
MEREALVQKPSSHCRDLTGRQVHADAILHHPVPISSFLESSCVLRIQGGAPAIGCPPASPRRREGFQMMGMHLLRSHRRGRVGMLWRRGWILWPFGPALMPVCAFVLEPHWDACGPRRLGASSLAVAQGLTTQLTQETPLPPLPIGPQRQITCWLHDVTHETPRVCKQRAIFASTVQLPQQTCRPIHPHHRPSLGRVRGDLRMHSGGQRIAFHDLREKLMRQGEQPEEFFTPLRRSGQR